MRRNQDHRIPQAVDDEYRRDRKRKDFPQVFLSIVFPELEDFVSSILGVTELKLLLELPTTEAIANCHLTRLTNLVETYSHGRHGKEWAIELRKLARNSIGVNSKAKALELQQTIRQITSLSTEIDLIEAEIKTIVIESDTTLMTILGIGYTFGAVLHKIRLDNVTN
ncbi:hypothetical protein AGMMS49983_09750 [Clostridia bacterium]|nr:hypothetical protein AGMMS49983_09750 [Clostridia bacterium]